MDCDLPASQQEVSKDLSGIAVIWHVLMAEAGSSQKLRTPTTVPQVEVTPAYRPQDICQGSLFCWSELMVKKTIRSARFAPQCQVTKNMKQCWKDIAQRVGALASSQQQSIID